MTPEPPDDSDFFLDWKPSDRHPLLVNTLKLIMLVGAPGSGKSTYAARLLASNPSLFLLCPDLIRAELGDINDQSRNAEIFSRLVPARMFGAKSQNRDILYDATNMSRRNRAGIIKRAHELGYRVEAHVFTVPIEECKARNLAREKKVPESVIDRMFAQWEEPSESEGIEKIVNVDANWLDAAGQEG